MVAYIYRYSINLLNLDFQFFRKAWGFVFIVTYWPLTEQSIKRCTCVNKQKNSGNRCIRSKISEYHLDQWRWLNSVQMRTLTGSIWVSNNYITKCHGWLESVSLSQWVRQSVNSSSFLVAVGERMPVEWEPAPDRRLRPPAKPGWAVQRKMCCYCREKNFGSTLSQLFRK